MTQEQAQKVFTRKCGECAQESQYVDDKGAFVCTKCQHEEIIPKESFTRDGRSFAEANVGVRYK